MRLQTTAQTAVRCLTSHLPVCDENETETPGLRLVFEFLLTKISGHAAGVAVG